MSAYTLLALERSATRVRADEALARVSPPLAEVCAADEQVRAREPEACAVAVQVVTSQSAEPARARDGKDGRDGRDGSPAAEMIVTRLDGSQLRCPRTGGPDTTPIYTCQIQES